MPRTLAPDMPMKGNGLNKTKTNWFEMAEQWNRRSGLGSETTSPQSRFQSSGSATPRSRHESDGEPGWKQNDDPATPRSRHRTEEWEQKPPVRGQEILQVSQSHLPPTTNRNNST